MRSLPKIERVYKAVLTPAENLVADELLLGIGNREIAEALNLGIKTIKFHLCNIYKKTNVKSRCEFIVKYLNRDLNG